MKFRIFLALLFFCLPLFAQNMSNSSPMLNKQINVNGKIYIFSAYKDASKELYKFRYDEWGKIASNNDSTGQNDLCTITELSEETFKACMDDYFFNHVFKDSLPADTAAFNSSYKETQAVLWSLVNFLPQYLSALPPVAGFLGVNESIFARPLSSINTRQQNDLRLLSQESVARKKELDDLAVSLREFQSTRNILAKIDSLQQENSEEGEIKRAYKKFSLGSGNNNGTPDGRKKLKECFNAAYQYCKYYSSSLSPFAKTNVMLKKYSSYLAKLVKILNKDEQLNREAAEYSSLCRDQIASNDRMMLIYDSISIHFNDYAWINSFPPDSNTSIGNDSIKAFNADYNLLLSINDRYNKPNASLSQELNERRLNIEQYISKITMDLKSDYSADSTNSARIKHQIELEINNAVVTENIINDTVLLASYCKNPYLKVGVSKIKQELGKWMLDSTRLHYDALSARQLYNACEAFNQTVALYECNYRKPRDKSANDFISNSNRSKLQVVWNSLRTKIYRLIAIKDPEFLRIKITDMKIQFEDGLIQNIQLNGKITGTQENISFTNPYPIGFSAKSDMTRLLETYWLVDASHQFCLNVSELIRYGINLRNQTMDYSPADQVLSITSHEVNKPMPVLKEQNQELFDAKIYTDCIGFEKNKPNSSVLIEIGRQSN